MIHIQNPALSLPQNSQDYMAHIFKTILAVPGMQKAFI